MIDAGIEECPCYGSTTICPKIAEAERRARAFLDCFKAVPSSPKEASAAPHEVQGFGLHGSPLRTSQVSQPTTHQPTLVPEAGGVRRYVNTGRVVFNGDGDDENGTRDGGGLDQDSGTKTHHTCQWTSKGCYGSPEMENGKESAKSKQTRSFDLCDAADTFISQQTGEVTRKAGEEDMG